MVTKTVDVKETPTNLEELLLLVREGAEILLTEDDKPIARITPVAPKQRILGLHEDSIWTSDDFDEPLSDDFWLGNE
jgi:antitoxin (DNA-binding transcriptional repressor) of toxin-antitoxin stability system